MKYLLPAAISDPVNGELSAFTTGMFLVLAAGLTEPVGEIRTGNSALASAGVCLVF